MLGCSSNSKRSTHSDNITAYFIYPMEVIFVSWGRIGQHRTSALFHS